MTDLHALSAEELAEKVVQAERWDAARKTYLSELVTRATVNTGMEELLAQAEEVAEDAWAARNAWKARAEVAEAERAFYIDKLEAAEARLVEAEKAIDAALYALNPNQGERPDPVTAAQWLRTTLPAAHSNHVALAALREKP